MDPLATATLVLGSVTLLFVSVWLGLGQRAATSRRRLWEEAAAVAVVERLAVSDRLLEGWSGPLRVRLAQFAHAAVRGTRITVDRGLPEELAVIPESLVRSPAGG